MSFESDLCDPDTELGSQFRKYCISEYVIPTIIALCHGTKGKLSLVKYTGTIEDVVYEYFDNMIPDKDRVAYLAKDFIEGVNKRIIIKELTD